MIDLQAVCDAYAVHDISNVGFTTVVQKSKCYAFDHVLLTGKCDFFVERWVKNTQNLATSTNYFYNSSIC